MAYTGRNRLVSNHKNITRENVADVLSEMFSAHMVNSQQIDYLWRYQKGEQPVLNRVKTVRPEICNKIVENRANEIVSFKLGYICGDPVQYVSRNSGEHVAMGINKLNDFMYAENKFSKDRDLFEWLLVCGVGYRAVFPSPAGATVPFEIYTLDPRNTFVVYSNDIRQTKLLACLYTTDKTGVRTYYVYTKDKYFVLEDTIVVEESDNYTGIPVFEYTANNSRLGSFEVALPLLDALNMLESNRLDGIEQFIQSILVFTNCDIDTETFRSLKDLGGLKLKSVDGAPKPDVKFITSSLDQTQAQTLKKDIHQAILEICGMPNRNGGSSTSDTGQAVLYRDGHSSAEGRAKAIESMFKTVEIEMLAFVLMLCNSTKGCEIDLTLSDINIQFTRRNYEAIQSKCQVLIQMLGNPKIHPLLAFSHSGMFTDPEEAYLMSMDYYEKQQAKWDIELMDDEREQEEALTGDVQEA